MQTLTLFGFYCAVYAHILLVLAQLSRITVHIRIASILHPHALLCETPETLRCSVALPHRNSDIVLVVFLNLFFSRKS